MQTNNDNTNNNQRIEREPNNKKRVFQILFQAWSVFRPMLVVLTGVLVLLAAIYFGIDYLRDNFWLPVDPTDDKPVEVVIEKRSTVGEIAKVLNAYGVVKNATVFEYYIDFSGYGSKMKAGTYVLNKQMTMHEIMEKLAKGDGRATVTKFQVIEGSNIEEMAEKLKKDGILTDTKRFLELCKTGKEFMNYEFVADLDNDENIARRYMLEGYLFPDTYEIYINSNEEAIITKMLSKFSTILTEKELLRAEELGMSIDEVITLASMIEKEAKTKDFSKVSAVFYNRLQEETKLGSCVTLHYALGIKRLILTEKDLETESLFNTYKYKGLPIGPICSPSKKAIEAALYPDQNYIDEKYFYFASKDPECGELVFNKTLEEHQAAREKYRPLWKAYDEKRGN